MKAKILFLFLVGWALLVSAQKPVKVACVGNSITYGYGLENRENDSYPAVLQKMLGKNYVVGNFGKSRATLLKKGHFPYVQQEEYTQALDFKGDIVVIHLGVNDTDPRNWHNYRDEFVPDYLSLIEDFRRVNPKVRIIIATISPLSHRHPRFESGTRDWHEAVTKAIKLVAQKANVELIDFHEPLYRFPHLIPDAVHPNAEGLSLLAKEVYSFITGDYGGLQMPEIYSDNMVLQRDIPLIISGKANANEKVSVKIGKQNLSTKVSKNGNWSVTLSPLSTNENYTLTISTEKQKKIFKNVVAGEVWLCSGQSNMEFYLKNASSYSEDLQMLDNQNIRLFDMKENWRTDPVAWRKTALDSINKLEHFKRTKWTISTKETASNFSAVAYHFGKMLQDSLKVPVGLICNAVGGSSAESWIDRRTLEYEFPKILENWKENDFIMEWVRGRAKENTKENPDKLQRHPYEPAYLFEAGIYPLKKFPIKGVIWYQGESNAHNIDAYSKLFGLFAQSWRTYFNDASLPIYYVQLSSIHRPSWGYFRDTQRRLLYKIPNVKMVVSSDLGHPTDVHPTDKKPIGERLGRSALFHTYHKKGFIAESPLFEKATFEGEKAIVYFYNAKGLRTSDNKAVQAFELAGEDGIFYPAKAEIKAEKVQVVSEKVKQPKYVRYAFQPMSEGNLVNEAGLPASTFSSM